MKREPPHTRNCSLTMATSSAAELPNNRSIDSRLSLLSFEKSMINWVAIFLPVSVDLGSSTKSQSTCMTDGFKGSSAQGCDLRSAAVALLEAVAGSSTEALWAASVEFASAVVALCCCCGRWKVCSTKLHIVYIRLRCYNLTAPTSPEVALSIKDLYRSTVLSGSRGLVCQVQPGLPDGGQSSHPSLCSHPGSSNE